MRTARLGLEGCESFVDDLIGCRVLYSVRDALLHRSLEIQPWHFPIRYLFIFSFFFYEEWLLGRGDTDTAAKKQKRLAGKKQISSEAQQPRLGVAQW